ncbi:MAG: protocatechuate 3,4-dioxygenase [Proteobacteria bacterium]|nr:protocatechuate 3,4-dioxygenase [Pseudomonadota bacterium]MDA1057207.1 protocatechuate 3,4-dioxygenase [Pseudomonadota bacterium]
MGNALTRRAVLGGALAISVATPLRAAVLTATPRQATGPYYPESLPLDADNDLLQIAGRQGRGAGEPLHLSGRVSDLNGGPIAAAGVEIWQCDAQGRYHHPRDRRGGVKADADFQGFGRTETNADGLYRFRTIVPVPYPGRAPHIHFKVVMRNGDSFVTQMYLRGHPSNDRDVLFGRLRDSQARDQLAVDLSSAADLDAGGRRAMFDIVLG